MAVSHRNSLADAATTSRCGAEDASTRVEAPRSLLHQLLLEVDPASRARQARILAEGVGRRWSAADFEISEIDAIAQALEDWDGELASQAFDERCVADLRRLAAADTAQHGPKLVHSLLRLAGHLSWQDRHDAAMELVREAVARAREMHAQCPDYGAGALADVLERAGRIWCQGADGAETAARHRAEELALRRAHFERTQDAEACARLIAALHRLPEDRDAAEAKSLREEALGYARRLVALKRSSGGQSVEAQAALATALVGCLTPIVTDREARFRLPSMHEAAYVLPLIEELLTLDPAVLPVDFDACFVVFALSVIGAATANRCGDRAAMQRLLQRSRDVGPIDGTSLSPEHRSLNLHLDVIGALLEQDIERATLVAQHAVAHAEEVRDWRALASASAFAHRLSMRHLLVLVEPDPSEDDRAAVIPAVLRAVCADAPAWRGDPVRARAAFEAIERLMRDACAHGGFDGQPAGALVHEVRCAFAIHSQSDDPGTWPGDVTAAWLQAVVRTLLLAACAARSEDFDFLWQLMCDTYEAAMRTEQSTRALDDIHLALAELRSSTEGHDDRATTVLDFMILRVLQTMADRTQYPWHRDQLAFQLGICAFACMRNDDLDYAAHMLGQAQEVCAALLVESGSANHLNAMRRTLEAKEILAERRGDAWVLREAQLERLAALRRLVVLDDNPERKRELDELMATLAREAPGAAVLH